MKRLVFLPLAAFVLTSCSQDITPPPADAPDVSPLFSSVHLKGGKNAKPGYSDFGLTLATTASVSGLGNGDLIVELSATGNVDSRCGNPGLTQFQAPGQNPAPVTVTGGIAVPGDELKNGNLEFTVSTAVPPDAGPRPAVAGDECPNTSWTYEVVDISFTDATISIFQPSDIFSDPWIKGPLVFQLRCDIIAASLNEVPIPGGQILNCTEL